MNPFRGVRSAPAGSGGLSPYFTCTSAVVHSVQSLARRGVHVLCWLCDLGLVSSSSFPMENSISRGYWKIG